MLRLGGLAGFDLPKKTAYLLAVSLALLYGVGAVAELNSGTDYLDYNRHIVTVREWSPEDILEEPATGHLRPAITKLSLYVFDNPKAIAFGFSMALVLSVYLLGAQVAGRRVGGIVAMLIISTSNFFKLFDTSAVYDNAWVFFYVMSVYMIGKKWQLVVPLFMLAVYGKPLAVLFVPVLFCWAYSSGIGRRQKAALAASLAALCAVFFLVSQYSGYVQESGFNIWGFVHGLHIWWWYLIADLYLTIAIPVMFLVLLALRLKKVPYAGPLLAMMAMAAFSGAFLEGFAILYIANEPYRYIPLVAAFAAAVPIVFRIRRRERAKRF